MLKKINIIILLLCLFSPIVANAKEITYSSSKIKFEINENEWKQTELSQERTYLDKKWTSDCGMIATGSYDIYNEFASEDLDGVTRDYFNYKNLFTSDEFAESIINEWKQYYKISDWKYENYGMKFIHASGITSESGIDINFDMYLTVNNGYGIIFQYMKAQGVNNGICSNTIQDVVKSASSTIKVKEENDMNEINYSGLLIGLALTIISYMIYPLIRTKLMHVEYDEKSCKKMALWNSIIVGGIFMIITLSIQENGTWNAAPAFLYYWINKSLWVSKNKKNNSDSLKLKDNEETIGADDDTLKCDNCGAIVKETDKYCKNCNAIFEEADEEIELETEEMFKCDNCGALVKESDTKCPKCGEKFDDEEEEVKEEPKAKSNMDQKYSDLTKLKELLDKDIISKEEFEKEKKKILNNK